MKIFNRGNLQNQPARWFSFFERASRARAAVLCPIAALVMLCAWIPVRADEAADRREEVKAQFAKAEGLREALEAKPERERSLQEYTAVVAAYRRVYLITPRAAEVPTAIKQVADLYAHMGEQFDPKYFRSALATYEFLVRDYPTSKYLQEAQLAVAALHKGPLNEPELAKQTYEDFLQQHPRSSRVKEVKAALAEIGEAEKQNAISAAATAAAAQPVQATATRSETIPQAANASSEDAGLKAGAAQAAPVYGPPVPPDLVATGSSARNDENRAPARTTELGKVRVTNAEGSTRIIVELSGQAKYQAARITRPERIYFDIENARLRGRAAAQSIEVPAEGYLKSLRVAQNRPDVVRVVLEPNNVKDYSVFELSDPDRLVIDVFGVDAPATTAGSPAQTSTPSTKGVAITEAAPKIAATSANVSTGNAQNSNTTTETSVPAPAAREVKAGPVVTNSKAASGALAREPAAKAPPGSAPTNTTGQPPLLSAKKTAEIMGPASLPEPIRAGGRSLTRVLGLKVSRIVIDPGHGGHDTGTIGPTGLMEKDLCLDVALRLGKIIQQRLPAAEIVYTREDDTFVALEQRTAMANDARADLLISIHANSSDDHKVRGIETYYLNFNAAPGAMEVAARENALAEGGVHQLEELVEKIARNEKIEESRDLAASIQDSLTKQANATARNRGVRKAPFFVLIGANMPSVLTEISFLSNPVDEQWLKKPDSRQKIAEGIYRGIERYLKSTNSLARNAAPDDSSFAEPVSTRHSGQ
jgi:N-acetylmuramoyl-L-alanine amidase